MIDRYDLYDMTAVLVNLRSDIANPQNVLIISKVIEALNTYEPYEECVIRKKLATIDKLDNNRWYFVFHNNVYVNHQILKIDYVYELLIYIHTELLRIIKSGEFDRAYDLADAIHSLPTILADNNFIIPKSFWYNYIHPYRHKWDRSFLKSKAIFRKK